MKADAPVAVADQVVAPAPAALVERPVHRISALDSLRGIAILAVVARHYLPLDLLPDAAGVILGPFAQGGVILFFMLSGFLIEQNLTRDDNLVRYGLHRVFRIVPAYWAALLVIFFVEGFVTRERLYSPREVIINATFLGDVFSVALMSGVFWTLLIEVKFYLVAPIVKRCGDRLTFAMPFAAVALNALIFAWRGGQASHLLTYITICFAGMQFGLWRRGAIGARQLAVVIGAVSAAMVVFASYYNVGVAVLAFTGFVLLACAVARKHPAFDLPALRFFGAVSYSWYLYHVAIGFPIISALRGTGSIAVTLLAIVAGTLATLALAWLSYRVIERPGIALGRGLERYARR
jgi:peptidoglycan/LPS O-acetylase OafA/YrhL